MLDGLNARAVDPADKTRNIGAVLQDHWLFSRTLKENIISGRFRQSLLASVACLLFLVLYFLNIAVDHFRWRGSQTGSA